MELTELEERLVPFVRTHLEDPFAKIAMLEPAPGHAGFAYLFDVRTEGDIRRYWIRLPPPNVKLEGTADVLRQVTVLNALDGTDVPHCPVVWSGDDPQWFGLPYFVVGRIEGDVFRGDWIESLTKEQRWGFEFDITRWDRFYERAADQHLLALQPRVRQLLLDQVPGDTNVGVYHGDFQWGNMMATDDAQLRAIIDWELCGMGANLNDVGWICAFNDADAWLHRVVTGMMPPADELEAMYREAWGEDAGNIRWFKALAVYKFAIITGFNLMLHRRGKRHDPLWEENAPSMKSNMEYALRMLTS